MQKLAVMLCGLVLALFILGGCEAEGDAGSAAHVLGDTWTRPADGMAMVWVPGGEFEMGSSFDELDGLRHLCQGCADDWLVDSFARELPAHMVELDGFWLDQTLVTNQQYAAFLNAVGNQVEGGVTWLEIDDENILIEQVEGEYRPREGYQSHPVWEVSWYGAAAYCEWVGGRLPTEAEWEYAARGSEGRDFPWGDGNPTCEQADYQACGITGSFPVLQHPAGISWCGAQDMASNVWEWVADWYGDYPAERQVNPQGPDSGILKVLRGGSWPSPPFAMRGAFRYMYLPMVRYNFGFRCARDIE